MTEFTLPYVSAESAGDYFEVLFAEASDTEGDYFLIQRQFESSDGGLFYVESHDVRLRGHFKVAGAELTRDTLRLLVKCAPPESVQIRFQADLTRFERLKKILRIMMPGPMLTIEPSRHEGPEGAASI